MIDWIRRSVVRRIAVVAGLSTALFAAGLWHFLVDRAIANEPAEVQRRIGLTALVGGVLLVVCVTAVAVVTVRRLLGGPLQRLTDAMASAEKGDFLIRARADRRDEIGVLGRSFNALLRKITEQQVDIIDTGRELTMTRRELNLKRELEEKARIIEEQNRQLETRLRELELLFDATKTITSQLELTKLLDTLCQQMGETLGFEEFAILLMDEASDQLVVRATYGLPNGEAIRGMRFNPGEGISGIVARTGEWVLIPDTTQDERYLHYKGQHLADGSFLCVPMRYQERLIGLFNVLRRRTNAFPEEDIRIMIALANSAAMAITNAQLFDRIAQLSLTDELTALANRRHLRQRATLEVENALRYHERLSFLMIDIDHFKRFNDRHGHIKGDEVLHRVAQTLLGNVRKVDTVARYGGEEFVVMLPRIGKDEAAAVAEKLRAAVARLELGDADAMPDGRITVSIGVASFPEDATQVVPLLERSDRALLEAKRAGRDRVVTYGGPVADAASG